MVVTKAAGTPWPTTSKIKTAIRFLRQKTSLSSDKFDELLVTYLIQNPEASASWNELQKSFDLAKFGGGKKEQHELQENLKLLSQCIQN